MPWSRNWSLQASEFDDEPSSPSSSTSSEVTPSIVCTSFHDFASRILGIQSIPASLHIAWQRCKDSWINFNLPTLLQGVNDLSSLVSPFEKEEIDTLVKHLPLDKAPGPDGFNTDFFKKCWHIISDDFYNLCNAFHHGDVFLKSLNDSHIVLVPKHDHPLKVSDYRPISLLNTSIKISTKILANRLQLVLPKLINKNQYGFIKARSIQDCLAWSLEFLHLCHQSKREIIILKLDFEKAFNKVDHDLMIQIMRHKGLPEQWLKWMNMIFGSGTSSALLNGVLGKTFHCKRGVRQGILCLLFSLFWQLTSCKVF